MLINWIRANRRLMLVVLCFIGAAALALVLKLTLDLRWTTAFAVAFVTVGTVVLAVYQREWRQKHPPKVRKNAQRPSIQEQSAVVKPLYYPVSQVSDLTKQYLDEDEARMVLYDEAHHWIVFIAMIFNPFWSADHDLQPEKSPEISQAENNWLDSFAKRGLRLIVRFVQMLYGVVALSTTLWIAAIVGFRDLLVPWVNVIVPVAAILAGLSTMPWVRKMQHVNEHCRFVVTEWRYMLIVDQLPWRTDTSVSVQFKLFASATPSKTIAGGWLKFIHVGLSTTDPGEPLPGWKYARNPDRLLAAFRYWSDRKKRDEVASYLESQQHLSRHAPSLSISGTNDPTQPLGIVHIQTE